MISRKIAYAVAQLVRLRRPEWDEAATIECLLSCQGDVEEITVHAIRVAEDQGNRTPKALTFVPMPRKAPPAERRFVPRDGTRNISRLCDPRWLLRWPPYAGYRHEDHFDTPAPTEAEIDAWMAAGGPRQRQETSGA